MLVAADLKTAFERDGYVIVEDVFTREEVAAAKDEVRRILAKVRTKDKDGNAPKDNGVFVGLTLNSECFKKMNADPRMVDVLEQVVGPNLEFWSDKIVYKSAGVDFGSPWHQDWTYWKGAAKFSVWVALDDATPENGCMEVVPGSHRLGLVTSFGSTLSADDASRHCDPSRVRSLPVARGEMLLLHNWLIHRSGINRTDQPRRAFTTCLMDARTISVSTGQRFPALTGERLTAPYPYVEQLEIDRAFLRDTAARSEEYALSLAAELERLRSVR